VPAAPDSYEWLSEGVLGVAGCITVVPGADIAKLEAAFGCDPVEAAATRYADSNRGPERLLDGLEAWLGASGDAALMVEENGFQGSRSEVLRPASKASAAGLAVSVFWNVEGLVMFSAARRGRMVCSEELMDCDPQDLPRVVRRLARLTEDEEADLVAVGAAMVEQLTGVAFGRDAVDGAVHRSLTPVLEDFWTYGPEDTPLKDGTAPHLVPLIMAADDETRRRLALWAAQVAAVEAGIAEERAIRESLDNAQSSKPFVPSPALGPLLARWDRERTQWRLAHDGYSLGPSHGALEERFMDGRCAAAQAMRMASHPDALEAALMAVVLARETFASSRSERGSIFRDDDAGRWHDGFSDAGTRERLQTFTELVIEALADPTGDWDALSARLPRPFTDEDRRKLIRADQKLQDEDAFATWQYGRRH
jgi:hypothetical protein